MTVWINLLKSKKFNWTYDLKTFNHVLLVDKNDPWYPSFNIYTHDHICGEVCEIKDNKALVKFYDNYLGRLCTQLIDYVNISLCEFGCGDGDDVECKGFTIELITEYYKRRLEVKQ